MKRIGVCVLVLGLMFTGFLSDSYARTKGKSKKERNKDARVNTKWEQKADINQDGIATKVEKQAAREKIKDKADINNDGVITKREKLRAKSRVNTQTEAKYDLDGDGWLQKEEAKELLKDRYRLIRTNGQAKVNSSIEAAYDKDADGIISYSEAQVMKDDLE